MNNTRSTLSKPSLRILEDITDTEDISPADLEQSLNDIVDPTALNQLFEPTATDDSARAGAFRSRV
ncbi:HalOD1 output domain-containing protein [Natrinema sp. SYSU A 869]|uniref:HalOD1 output domain-containing protein n=1 Tax=Natrinema sp. SYSU A 869 TaxID=2871694 RepID=UPI001CA3DDA7|nr:HalOD1 output domain-containing protein [Natrinema sp. SYSU A 869]